LVLETTWMTRTGWMIVRDALLIGPWHHDDDRSNTHRRSPTDWDADHVLLRTVKCVHGAVELQMECEPVFDYGTRDCVWEYAGHGYHKAVGSAEARSVELHLGTDLRLGFDWEATDCFDFVAEVAEGDERLQIMYGIGGERELTEQTLERMTGYEGARPVRIGNGAFDQDQHDVWGALLDSVYLHTRSRDFMPERVWPILKTQVERAIENWRDPDRGIWEVRGPPKHFTSSKVMCWVACDRGARLARLREEWEFADRWQKA